MVSTLRVATLVASPLIHSTNMLIVHFCLSRFVVFEFCMHTSLKAGLHGFLKISF